MTREDPFFIPVLAVYGVGLIGGSLAIRLKEEGVVGRVIGVGRSRENLEKALASGAIDEIQTDPVKAANDADVIVLATPVNTINDLLKTLRPAITGSKTITDVGSVKSGIVDAARQELGDLFPRFVAGHPIAGREKSGITAASGDLFENHKIILTPVDETDSSACELIRQMWLATGAEVRLMDLPDHDRILSITSHLPHVLAFVVMDFLASSPDQEKCYEMTGGGFYDFTRTASSDPEMWRDICIMNDANILENIDEFQRQLSAVRKMIANQDGEAIEALFRSARAARSRVTEKRKIKH